MTSRSLTSRSLTIVNAANAESIILEWAEEKRYESPMQLVEYIRRRSDVLDLSLIPVMGEQSGDDLIEMVEAVLATFVGTEFEYPNMS